MAPIPILNELVIIAVTAVIVNLLLGKLRIPVLVGLLLAGALIGPAGLGLIEDVHDIEALAEVGVVMLLFTIGLEFSLTRLRPIARLVALGGALQVGLAIAGTAVAAYLFGDTLARGLFMGFLVALSSTAIVLRSLAERGELSAPHGRFIVGVLIFQDLCVVPMVLIVPLLAGGDGASPFLSLSIALGKAVLVVIVTLVVARRILPRFFALVDAHRSRELFLLAVIGVCIGIAWLTSLAGLSLALGAFLGGMVLADTDFRHRALGEMLPLRDVFTSLFFMSLGMLLDLSIMLAEPVRVLLLFVAFVLGKGAVGVVAAMAMRFPARVAWLAGAGLAQFGEFGFVLVKLGENIKLIEPSESHIIIAAGVLSMLVTRLWLRIAPHIPAGQAILRPLEKLLRVRGMDETDPGHEQLRDHVVVAGFGVAGRLVTRALKQAGVPYLILELNAEAVRRAGDGGEPIYYADVGSEDALDHARIKYARALVLMITDPNVIRQAIGRARDLNPSVPVLVRTPFVADVPELTRLGATEVVSGELQVGIEITTRLAGCLPRDDDSATRFTSMASLEVRTILLHDGMLAIGKRPSDVQLPEASCVLAVATVHQTSFVSQVDPSAPLGAGDVVFLLGPRGSLDGIMDF